MKEKSKSFKKWILIAILAIFLPCCLLLSGCSEVYVTSIEFTSTNGNSNVYTISYSNGKTSTLTVENGKDGSDLTLEDIFNECVKLGLYPDNSKESFEKFVASYISNKVDTSTEQLNVYSSLNSVVSIYSAFHVRGEYEKGYRTVTYTGYDIFTGAGVVYKMENDYSYIVTNSHVVTDYISTKQNKLPEKIMIWQYGYEPEIIADYYAYGDKEEGEYYYTDYELVGGVEASCVGYSVDYDLAVLRVATSELKAKNKDVCAVKVADGYSLLEQVYAIGNPSGEGVSITAGVVSVYSEVIDISEMPADNATHYFRVLRMDNAIYGGNSGGGLFNGKGELVGIVNAGSTIGDNFSFALPIDSVVPCADRLIHYYENGQTKYDKYAVTMEKLGVTLKNEKPDFNEITGKTNYDVKVVGVSESSALDMSGIRVGDVITGIIIDGKSADITNSYQLNDLLLTVRSNSVVDIKVNRSGLENTVRINSDYIQGIF